MEVDKQDLKAQHEGLVITPRPLIIKGNDGEPLLRKTIQYDFLQALFEDPTQCFTDPMLPAPNNKVTFNALYRKALINSTKMTGSQRVKMEQFQDFGLVMAQVCLLTNIGRINTTLAFYPDMRTALRYYHSIPSLQRDDTTRQHMYDAARMKTVLKGCVGSENPPVATPQDILNRQSAGFSPACNPVAALFAFTTHSTLITKDHFKDCEFMDLFLPGPYPSKARARALLWLLYRYLEDSRGPNPFQDPSSKGQKHAPPVPRMSMDEMELENVDTPEELDYGRKMLQYRIEFLNKTEAEYAQDAAKGKVDPNTNVRGQRAMKKKAAIGRAVQEELAALETQSNLSRDSSLPPSHYPSGSGLAIGGGGVDGALLHAAVSAGGGASVLNPQQALLMQTERDARHTLSQPPAVSLYTHAMNHMVNVMIDSDDEDTESQAQQILDDPVFGISDHPHLNAVSHTNMDPDYEDYIAEDGSDDWDEDYEPEEDMNEDDEDIEMEIEEGMERLIDDDDEGTVAIDLNALLGKKSNLLSPTKGMSLNLQGLLASIGSTSPTTARNRDIIARLLGSSGRVLRVAADDDDDEEDEGGSGWWPSHGRHFQYPPHLEPQPAGVELLNSGEFGPPPTSALTKQPLQKTLNEAKRSLSLPVRSELFKDLVPNTIGTVVAKYGSNAYAGQFSTDSTFYYTCVQDFRLHIYDTKAPVLRKPHVDGDHVSTMKHTKSIRAVPGGWTITDSHLSPDNSLLAYAVMSPTVFLANTGEGDMDQRSVYFGNDRGSSDWHDHYGIWSCRFSADGKELVAGGSGKLMVYDLIADRRSVKIEAHRADVNSCCWADSGGNVLISASDDTFIKVWDRRSLGSSPHPAGVLVGHTEGLTYVAPKGDGRYVVSNGKDQTLKLWDLRKMVSFPEWKEIRRGDYGIRDFDYRAQIYPKPQHDRHPLDCSVMSYRGHSVLRTLIRCNFSPAETTGSRYIYSGSSDGMVHIWSLDGTVVQRIDRRNVIEMGHDPSGTEEPKGEVSPMPTRRNRHNQTVVRDVAWHSQEPVLMTCSWASDRSRTSDVAKHEWKGLNKLGGRLEDFVAREEEEAKERRIPLLPSSGGWYR